MKSSGSGKEANLRLDGYVYATVSSWTIYHFHDTSALAPMRRPCSARDFRELRPDAGNIAAFLRRLRDEHPAHYARIRDSIRLVAPFFDVCTQSPLLMDHFDPEHVIIVERGDGASVLRRLETGPLAQWLDEYSLGELTRRDIVETGPRYG